jgi:hypothetical protein
LKRRASTPTLRALVGYPEDFFLKYWGRRAFLAAAKFDHSAWGAPKNSAGTLPDLAAYNALLSTLTSPLDGWFSLVKGRAELPARTLLTEDGMLDLAAVYTAYRGGHTLLLTKVQRRHFGTAVLCTQLERELTRAGVSLKRAIGANAYLTPPMSQGFDTHYDAHDVFVIQLEGRKRWRVYGEHVKDATEPPLEPISAEDAGAPKMNVWLTPGDVLYIPRGVLHDAQVRHREHSLHLTLSLEPTMWSDLFLELMANDSAFRGRIPREVLAKPTRLQGGVRKLAERMTEPATLVAAARNLRSSLGRKGQFFSNRGLRDSHALPTVGVDSLARLAPSVTTTLEIGRDEAVLYASGRAVRLAAGAAVALRRIMTGKSFRVGSLPALGREERVALVRALLEHGIVELSRSE